LSAARHLQAGAFLQKKDMLIATIIFAVLGIGAGALLGAAIPGTTIAGLKLAMIYVPAFVVGVLATIAAIAFCLTGVGLFAFVLTLSTVAASLLGSLLGSLWARYTG
jgi:hypothetical protein